MLVRASAVLSALLLLPAAAGAQQPCTSDARHVVNELYQHILERSADRGSDQWVRQLRSGQATVREVVRQLVVSSEHAQRFVPTESPDDRERAVRNLFRHILGREADPSGLRAHVQGLEGQGVGAVIDNMLDSPEYRERFGEYGIPGTPGLRFCGQRAQGSAGPAADRRFRGLDTDDDGRITRGEWRGSRESFNTHDWNRDGVLTGDEVREALRRTAAESEEREFNPFNRQESGTGETFASIDHNGDNRISEAEWLYGYDAFRRADRNGDGVLSRAEFERSPAAAPLR